MPRVEEKGCPRKRQDGHDERPWSFPGLENRTREQRPWCLVLERAVGPRGCVDKIRNESRVRMQEVVVCGRRT